MIKTLSILLLTLFLLQNIYQSNGLIESNELTIPPDTLASLMNFGFLENGTISQEITVTTLTQ